MAKVNVLPSDVIAKIAAGEVVDRPSSVVKELLENAIDAGATAIEIHLKDAGKELIHIKDNGSGITKEDLETIFQRHATSKIKSIDDLETLSSMGFRGEALYSIGSVSDVTIRTAVIPAQAGIQNPHSHRMTLEDGWELHIRGGIRESLQPAAASSHGTDIKVAELFFNTPARRKFLKNNTSELGQIVNHVLPYALIYPQLKLLLTHQGRDLLDLRASANRLDRIAHALNVEPKHLMEIEQEFPEEGLKVRLTLGDINIQRPRRDLQYIFVNNRPVESKNLSFNINDIYKLILPPGVYGCFVAEIHLNPSLVDANIHPTKREVRLQGEARINSMIRRMAEYQLMQHGSIKQINTNFPLSTAPGQSQTTFTSPQWNERPASNYLRSSVTQPTGNLFDADTHLFQSDSSLKTRFTHARYIGQWIHKFLLFEEGSSLFLVDQHAAQERIMFEKFTNQVNNGKLEIQPLLTPLLLKLTVNEKVAYDDIKEKLHDLGIETTQFDNDTIAIQTQPVLLKNITNAVRLLLSEIDVARCDKATLSRRACKASIVTGDSLSPLQVEYQRKELLNCEDPFTCPHGRPTVIELTEGFIDRQFLRS